MKQEKQIKELLYVIIPLPLLSLNKLLLQGLFNFPSNVHPRKTSSGVSIDCVYIVGLNSGYRELQGHRDYQKSMLYKTI